MSGEDRLAKPGSRAWWHLLGLGAALALVIASLVMALVNGAANDIWRVLAGIAVFNLVMKAAFGYLDELEAARKARRTRAFRPPDDPGESDS